MSAFPEIRGDSEARCHGDGVNGGEDDGGESEKKANPIPANQTHQAEALENGVLCAYREHQQEPLDFGGNCHFDDGGFARLQSSNYCLESRYCCFETAFVVDL